LKGTDGQTESYFIEGGFVQIKGSQVSVLTSAAKPVSAISRAAAVEELNAAKAEKARTDEEMAALETRLERARKLVSMATVD
jgi:F-type H+-transporting ATPase subunit epsilon